MSAERCQRYRDKARESARVRRTNSKSLMDELSNQLPFPREVVESLDQSSRLRLATCYVRVKSFFTDGQPPAIREREYCQQTDERQVVKTEVKSERDEKNQCMLLQKQNSSPCQSVLQNMFLETLDGFLIICHKDGTILYISDSIHKHLGLFQSDLVGHNLSNIVHECDMETVSLALESAYMSLLGERGNTECSFFCRMKCNDRKMSSSCQNFKLIYLSGHLKLQSDGTTLLMGVVSPVTPPTIIELDLKDNMFVTHYSLDMKCVYCDERLTQLLGYERNDLIGHVPFEFHHHDDTNMTIQCSQELMLRGEAMSSYYRVLTKGGHYVWIQSRASIVYDRQTHHPSYVFCVNYFIVDNNLTQEKDGSTKIRRVLEPIPINYSQGEPSLSPLSLSPLSSPSTSSHQS